MPKFRASVGDVGYLSNHRAIAELGFRTTSICRTRIFILADDDLHSSAPRTWLSGSFTLWLINLPTPILDILFDFSQEGIQPLILYRTLIEVDDLMGTFAIVASFDST